MCVCVCVLGGGGGISLLHSFSLIFNQSDMSGSVVVPARLLLFGDGKIIPCPRHIDCTSGKGQAALLTSSARCHRP